MVLACGSGGGSSAPFFVSQQQEIEIGATVHADIIKETPLLADGPITQYMAKLGAELVPYSRRPQLVHHFYVLDTEQINAFAAPGGHVYVTVGLMRHLNSRAELAGVIGHEVGHISGYHGANAVQTAVLTGVLSNVIFGADSNWGGVAEWVVGIYLGTAHSKDLELEADDFGVEFALAAGYNPWGLVDFFEFLLRETGPSLEIASWLSSHPKHEDRIAASTAQLEGLEITREDATLKWEDMAMPYADIKMQLPAPKPVVEEEAPADGDAGSEG